MKLGLDRKFINTEESIISMDKHGCYVE